MRRRLGRAALGFALLLAAAGVCTAFSGDPASSSPAEAGAADATSAQDVASVEDSAVRLAVGDGGCTEIATPNAFAPPHAGSQLSG